MCVWGLAHPGWGGGHTGGCTGRGLRGACGRCLPIITQNINTTMLEWDMAVILNLTKVCGERMKSLGQPLHAYVWWPLTLLGAAVTEVGRAVGV